MVFACSTMTIFAQTEATTKDGKEVTLYDDGTWEFKKEISETVKVESTSISENMNAESEIKEIYFCESERLDRFFSSPKNKIRGKAKCIIKNGKPQIEFSWETYLGDGNRYFGYLKSGTMVTLKLKGDNNIQLTLTKDLLTEAREKYNVTIFKGTADVTNEQVALLVKYPIETVTVDWKKKPEEYKVDNTDFFRSEFVTLLKE